MFNMWLVHIYAILAKKLAIAVVMWFILLVVLVHVIQQL